MKDTYKYHLILNGEVVHKGVTYDLERREGDHQRDHRGSVIKQIGRPVSREEGLKWSSRVNKRPFRNGPALNAGMT